MIEHSFRHRRLRAPFPRRVAKGFTAFSLAAFMLSGTMDFAAAAPAAPAPSALTMGGILGILDIFNDRDPLRKVKPDQVYKTKYGNITGAQYEQRVLEERVIAYEAAIRAGGTSQAGWSTRRRARQVERDIRRDDDITAVAAGMMAGDWEERAAAEAVLRAAEEEKSGWFRSTRSSRPSFQKGMGSYRTPVREEDDATVRDSQGTVYLNPARPSSRPPVMMQATPVRADRSLPSLATMKPTTREPVQVAPIAPVSRPAPPATPTSEIPEVKRIGSPPKPVSIAPAAEPKTADRAEKKSGEASEANVPGNTRPMSSKEKLRMAVFGDASDIARPEAETKDAEAKDSR